MNIMSKNTIRLMVMCVGLLLIAINVDAFDFDRRQEAVALYQGASEYATPSSESAIKYESEKEASLKEKGREERGYLASFGEGHLIGSVGVVSGVAMEKGVFQDMTAADRGTSHLDEIDNSPTDQNRSGDSSVDQDAVAGTEAVTFMHETPPAPQDPQQPLMGGDNSQDNAVEFRSETIAPAGPGLERKSAIISRGF